MTQIEADRVVSLSPPSAWTRRVPGDDPWVTVGAALVAVAIVGGSVDLWLARDDNPAYLIAAPFLGMVGLWCAIRRHALAVVVSVFLIALEVRNPAPEGTWAVAGGLLFLFALQRQRLDAVLAGTTFAGVSALADLPWSGGLGSGVVGTFTLAGAMVGIGQWVREQRRYVAAEMGRRREEAERRRIDVAREVAEERLKIARDLHDSVAHHIAVVSVQTNLAMASVAISPNRTKSALRAVQAASSDVLTELQLVLGVLRGDASGADPALDSRPRRVRDLTTTFEEIGLRIDTVGIELFEKLPPGARTVVYRIVQEALTNAQRYGKGHASLRMILVDHGLEVVIRNPVDPATVPPTGGSGHGITGMIERAEGLGGSLQAGPEGDEFVVRAWLPTADLSIAPRAADVTHD